MIKYPSIPWTEIMGLRDIIAHEHHKIDEEEIFNVIKQDLVSLLNTIRQMKTVYHYKYNQPLPVFYKLFRTFAPQKENTRYGKTV